jgi:ABC-type sugar transport system permease subunit
MKQSFWWRIVAVVFAIVVLGLFFDMLIQRSLKNQQSEFTFDYAFMNAEQVGKIYHKLDLIQREDLNFFLTNIEQSSNNIVELAVVQGRTYLAHSDSNQVDARISKEVFDNQRNLQRSFSQVEDELHYLWEEDSYLYYALIEDGNFTGLVYIKLTDQIEIPIKSPFFYTVLVLFLLGIFIIISDRYFTQLSIITAPVLYILAIVIITTSIGGILQDNVNRWNEHKALTAAALEATISSLGVDMEIDYEPLERDYSTSVRTWGITLSILGVLYLVFIFSGLFEKIIRSLIKHRMAYGYILPAMLGVFLLVFFPFIYAILIGFTNYGLADFSVPVWDYFTEFNNYIGFGNFINILSEVSFTDYNNFYFTLLHTIIWTISNVVLHVGIGVILALILNDLRLKGRTIFRVLLILPWAIPSYITALIWRGLFHQQFGAVNSFIGLLGFDSNISWFTQPVTSFLANLATNVWLGFPFMMVIALGALQSIPRELYEASAIDGSTKWQSFWNVTAPLLKPAMIPAIIIGTIWTFNQFNVIYLVSGGGPDGATEILITDSYRLAFEQYRYGYAAAYSIIIFLILFAYGVITAKVSKATQGVYE